MNEMIDQTESVDPMPSVNAPYDTKQLIAEIAKLSPRVSVIRQTSEMALVDLARHVAEQSKQMTEVSLAVFERLQGLPSGAQALIEAIQDWKRSVGHAIVSNDAECKAVDGILKRRKARR